MDDLPRVGFGTYGNTDPEQCTESVQFALDHGYRHIDTAQSYGNEAAVGAGLARANVHRDDVVVATKVAPGNLAYDDVIDSTQASRNRLGVDVIDLLYIHWPIRTYDPEETLAAFDDLRNDGVIRHVGVSNFTPALLEEARHILDAPIVAHQAEMHPLLSQETLRADARDHGYSFVAYSPLAKGRVGEVEELIEISDRYEVSPFQLSLAWLLAKGVAVVPKATGADHIRENWLAQEIDLDPRDVARIDTLDRDVRVVDPDNAPWN